MGKGKEIKGWVRIEREMGGGWKWKGREGRRIWMTHGMPRGLFVYDTAESGEGW